MMHFAAQTHVDNSFGNSFEFTENNIRGTHVLLETVKTLGTIKRFLHVSTDEVYGESSYEKDQANVEAASLLEPTNPYSATKAGAEMLVMAYGRSYNLPYIITRGNNVYGPHQYPEKAIPKFIMLAQSGGTIPIHGHGMATRSYMHVYDAASAFDTILHKGAIKGVYNIGAHEERTVLSVAQDIGKSLGKDISKTIVHDRLRDVLAERFADVLSDGQHGPLLVRADVVNPLDRALVQDGIKRGSRVVHVHVRTRRHSVAVDGNGAAALREHDELGDGLLRVLVRTVHVVTAGDDVREVVRPAVGHDKHLSARLGGRVRVGRLQEGRRLNVSLILLVGGLAVDLVGGDV